MPVEYEKKKKDRRMIKGGQIFLKEA